MALKICHEWMEIRYIEAICPHCREIDTYHSGVFSEGGMFHCVHCGKHFKLGEQK